MRVTPEHLRDAAPPSDGLRTGTVVVTGAAGLLGRSVVERLRADPAITNVIGLDGVDDGSAAGGVTRLDLATADLKTHVEEAAAVVHLASSFGPSLDDDPAIDAARDVDVARRLFDAAGDAGVAHLVVLSSATVYGAWANNAVPLVEDATVRPRPDFAYAVQRAEVERLVSEWREGHPGPTATVLRPAPLMGEGEAGWLARGLRAARRVADSDGDPPAQYLHVEDLASAVALAVRDRIDGARNVAPDGWLRAADHAALSAGVPGLRVPRAVADRVARLRWRLRLAPVPPGMQSYARHPWVVANDRLKADGWVPVHANEEAFVSGTPAGPWATMSPRRRQELALGVAGTGVVAAIGGGVGWAIRRRRRRR